MQKWIILTVVVVLAILTTVIVFNMEIETEYVPEVEASSESLRKTNVSLYFKNKQSNLIDKVNILIDSKKIIKDGACRVHGGGFAGTIQAFVKNEMVKEYKKNMDPRQFDYIRSDIVITKLFAFLKANNEMYVEA